MLEFVKGRIDVARHGKADGALLVVPMQVDSAIQAVCPINGGFVVLFKCSDKMIRILVSRVFDSEIVNHECEGDVQERLLDSRKVMSCCGCRLERR